MGTGLKLYRSQEHAGHWIGEDKHGALLFFPAQVRGWISRTPYGGSKQDLEEVSPMLARGTKWPGAIGGKARDPSGKPSRVVLGIRVTEAEREVWQRAADARGLHVTEWVRVAANEVAGRPAHAAASESGARPTRTARTARSARSKRSRTKP